MSILVITKSRLYRSGFSFPKISFPLVYHYLCRSKFCVGQKNKQYEHVHHIGVTSHFAYVDLWITRSIFAIPLDFEIASLTCSFIFSIDRNDIFDNKYCIDPDILFSI